MHRTGFKNAFGGTRTQPSGAKAPHFWRASAARLKPCPTQNPFMKPVVGPSLAFFRLRRMEDGVRMTTEWKPAKNIWTALQGANSSHTRPLPPRVNHPNKSVPALR